MHRIKHFIRKRGIFVVLLVLGLYYGCTALWNLSNTLLFTHEAATLTATVIDVRQRPFDSYTEALRHGNLPWDGDIAYRPIVSFIMPAGIPIRAYTVPELDNRDYQRGQQVEIITHAHDPNQAHLKRWKFQWGADSLLLAMSLLLGVPSWFILFPKRKNKPAARTQRAPLPARQEQQPRRKRPEQKKPQTSTEPSPRMEKPFTLSAEPTAPSPKKRTPRKKNTDSAELPKKPRTPRRKKETSEDAAPTPRKSSRKKKEA